MRHALLPILCHKNALLEVTSANFNSQKDHHTNSQRPQENNFQSLYVHFRVNNCLIIIASEFKWLILCKSYLERERPRVSYRQIFYERSEIYKHTYRCVHQLCSLYPNITIFLQSRNPAIF